MYRIAICDDEAAIREQVIRILDAHPSREKFTLSEFSSGEALLDSLRSGRTYLLLILDIELETTNGVALGRLLRQELRDNATQILYISAHESYAMELFDLRPLNFLVKPIDPDKLTACITQALELSPCLDATLTFFTGKVAQRVPLREIRYLESYNRKLTIHTVQRAYSCSQKLAELLAKLPQPEFFQIHQSFVVNDRFVHRIQYNRLELDDGLELPISQTYRRQVRDLIFQNLPRGGGAL